MSQPTETARDETSTRFDEETLRTLYQQLLDGWNHGDGDAFAGAFTEDGHLVGFDGTHFEGQEEIASFHQELFDTWMNGTRLVGQLENIQFLSADVAVLHAVGGTIRRGESEPSPERDSIQTLVALKQESEWRFVALHNTRLRPMDRGYGSVVVWQMSDWLWKIIRRNENRFGDEA